MPKRKKLRIAVFCSAEFSIPPNKKIAKKIIFAPLWLTQDITNGLVSRGHEVTLFAGSDSRTNARLWSDGLPALSVNKEYAKYYKRSPRESTEGESVRFERILQRYKLVQYYDFLMLSVLYKQAIAEKKFDLVYNSMMDMRGMQLGALAPIPSVCTMHDPIPHPNMLYQIELLRAYKQRFAQLHLVGISQSQIRQAPELFSAVIYNGINVDHFAFRARPGTYLLTTGRITPEKGTFEAIQVAKKTGLQLIIAGHHKDDVYWRRKVAPYVDGKHIVYRGMLSRLELQRLYKNAKAFLFPIQWEEPFGLVMGEAMSCGTPVIAFRQGAVPEIVEDGKTGFIVNSVSEMVSAVRKVDQIDRAACRQAMVQHFSTQAMIDRYEDLFFRVGAQPK